LANSHYPCSTIESAGDGGKGTKRLTGPVPPPHPGQKGAHPLRELVRTNDIVLVSAVGALLDGANIHHLVLDQNMSVIEGSLGILPRRILVHEDDNRAARQLLSEAGLAHELRPDE
jgi:Putative prokaryotic signal transducing protein